MNPSESIKKNREDNEKKSQKRLALKLIDLLIEREELLGMDTKKWENLKRQISNY